MSDLVERVASAIYEQQHGDLWDRASDAEKRAVREMARAAIEAMREPTDAMMDQGGRVHHMYENRQEQRREIAAHIHRSMIDAALKD